MMMRFVPAALLFLVFSTSESLAQAPAPPAPRQNTPVVKFAKWGLLGVAGALGLYALQHSTRAEDAYGELRSICLATPARCDHRGGRYEDQVAESLYRRALSEDSRAQVGIFGGQTMLFGSVGLFIYDLRDGQEPTTIPYPGPSAPPGVVLATIVF